MTTAMMTNVLITIVIALIGFVSNQFIKRLDRFEKIVQGILMSDVAVSKDLEQLKSDVKDHETRISQLEKQTIMNSTFLNLNVNDFIKGLAVAVLTSVLTIVYNTLQTGSLAFDWTAIATTALTAAIAYLMKNLLTNTEGKMLKKDVK